MNRNAIALSLGLLLGPALPQGATAQGALPAITEAEAHAIGVDAYLYFYPLISTDITRLTSTNIEAGKEPLKGPMNTFVSAAAYPPGDLKLVVRINFWRCTLTGRIRFFMIRSFQHRRDRFGQSKTAAANPPNERRAI